ncbi:MAG: glycosyltransferase family 4 protein [Acidimicrobiales bacterium]
MSPGPGPGKARPRNLVYVCKAVDADHPSVATQVRWINVLAGNARIGRLTVLTRHRGRGDLAANVVVKTFGGAGWPSTTASFLAVAARLKPVDADAFLVVQGGPYPALLAAHKLLWRRPVYQWKAQPHVSARMAAYARWCDDLIFTATPGSFPESAKPGGVRVVGHGIDTGHFRPPVAPVIPERDLVALGRVAPIKRLGVVLDAMAACATLGFKPTLDIVGPSPVGDPVAAGLLSRARELGCESQVRFMPAVAHESVPALLSRYRAMVNFSDTAFDKAAGEAMACGLAVVTTNPCTVEMLPSILVSRLAADHDDPADQARIITEVLGWDATTRAQVGEQLRQVIVANHSLDSLFDKILDQIAVDRGWQ